MSAVTTTQADTTVEAPRPAHGPAPTTTPPPGALARIIAPVKGRLVRAAALGALASAVRVAALVLAGLVVRALLDGDGIRALWLVAGVTLAMVAAAVLTTASSEASHHAAFDHEVIMRRTLTRHLGVLPLGTVQRLGAGGVKKIVQGDVRGLHAIIADSPPMVGAAAGGLVASLLAIGLIEWRLLLVVLVLIPLLMAVMSVAMRDYATERAAYDRALEEIDAASVQYVQGMQEVRTFDGGSASFSGFAARVQAFTKRLVAWTDKTRGGALASRLIIAPLPATVLVAAAGSLMALAGWVDPVSVVVVLLLAALPMDATLPLMLSTDHLKRAHAAAERIAQVLDEPALEEPDSPRAPADGSVVLREVTFSYDPARPPALERVSINIPDGTVCALVGASGSGKSTVARLVPRFFDVSDGAVLVGGVDVRSIASEELLRHIALVFQEPFLVHASIRDNLTIGRADATDAELEQACRAARIHEEILALPQGYDTLVGERGSSLSGGQRQRLTVARALLSDARVVILDEATAFADPENEAAIQEAIAELTRGRTVIVVAHRLSTIVDAHQIVVLDHGRVVERGTHADLLAHDGRYAALWAGHLRAQAWGLRHGNEEQS